MSIVLPIFFAAVLVGLFVRRMTPLVWGALAAWILLIIVYQFLKR